MLGVKNQVARLRYMCSLWLEVELHKGSSFSYGHRIRNGDSSYERVRVPALMMTSGVKNEGSVLPVH